MTPKNNTADGYYSSFLQVFDLFSQIPGLTIDQSEETIYLCLQHEDGPSSIRLIPVFPGMTLLALDYRLSFFSYEAFLPLSGSSGISPERLLEMKRRILKYKGLHDITKFNYCHSGRTELLTGNDVYVYMKEHEFCIDRSPLTNQCAFPQGYYSGFGLIMEQDFPVFNPGLADAFGVDQDILCRKYLNKSNQFTYITRCSSETLALCEQIFHISRTFQKGELYRLRTLIFHLIGAYQFAAETSPIGSRTFLTNSQTRIAKNVAERLQKDLASHTSAREMAADYGTSETSLKNYFREVYGENLSSYRARLRMKKAAELLQNTSLCVSEIAAQTGYSSQSKFAAAFKKYYGAAPVEFRRKSALSALETKKP